MRWLSDLLVPDPVIGVQPRLLRGDEAPLAIPILSAIPYPVAVAELDARVRDWLSAPEAAAGAAGIMTLRGANGVIVALFFFTVSAIVGPARLVVPCLRAVEPAGRDRVLAATLRTMASLGDRLGCPEAILMAEHDSCAWNETVRGLWRIGGALGFVPFDHGWIRVVRDVPLPGSRQSRGPLPML